MMTADARPAEELVKDCLDRRVEYLQTGESLAALPAYEITDEEAGDLAWFIAQESPLLRLTGKGLGKGLREIQAELLAAMRAGEATLFGTRLAVKPAVKYSENDSP